MAIKKIDSYSDIVLGHSPNIVLEGDDIDNLPCDMEDREWTSLAIRKQKSVLCLSSSPRSSIDDPDSDKKMDRLSNKVASIQISNSGHLHSGKHSHVRSKKQTNVEIPQEDNRDTSDANGSAHFDSTDEYTLGMKRWRSNTRCKNDTINPKSIKTILKKRNGCKELAQFVSTQSLSVEDPETIQAIFRELVVRGRRSVCEFEDRNVSLFHEEKEKYKFVLYLFQNALENGDKDTMFRVGKPAEYLVLRAYCAEQIPDLLPTKAFDTTSVIDTIVHRVTAIKQSHGNLIFLSRSSPVTEPTVDILNLQDAASSMTREVLNIICTHCEANTTVWGKKMLRSLLRLLRLAYGNQEEAIVLWNSLFFFRIICGDLTRASSGYKKKKLSMVITLLMQGLTHITQGSIPNNPNLRYIAELVQTEKGRVDRFRQAMTERPVILRKPDTK